jgi:uncharacterized protein YggT (Ycf19 family)
MEGSVALKLLTLFRQIAFIAFIYLLLGWWVDRKIDAPDSKAKAFFKVLCFPVTRPVSRFMAPGSTYGRILGVSVVVIAVTWFALLVVTEVLKRA